MTRHAPAQLETVTANLPVSPLQRACACGEAAGISGKCSSCAAHERLGVQPKLTIKPSGDRWEQEADRIADKVVSDYPLALRGPLPITPLVQRQAAEEDEEEGLQAKRAVPRQGAEQEDQERPPATTSTAAGRGPAVRAAAAVAGNGRALSASERAYFEPRFGRDLSSVRIHDDAAAGAAAQAINARAYTLRNHIALAPGAYDRATSDGRRLMAHELTHTLQQGATTRTETSLAAGPRATATVQRASEDESETIEAPPGPPSELQSTTPRVRQIRIACAQGKVVFDAEGGSYIYNMFRPGSCSLESEEFPAKVEFTARRINFNPAPAKARQLAERDESIDFGFKLRRGQENPKTLLQDQSTVIMKFVSQVESETEARPPPPEKELTCLHRFPQKPLIDEVEESGELFKRKEGKYPVWTQRIPLGPVGWVTASATATYSMEGGWLATYGAGRLHDVCITREARPPGMDVFGAYGVPPRVREELGVPPEVEMSAEMAKRLADGNAVFGGQARFVLPASVVVQLKAEGRLKAGLDYLGIVGLAAVDGGLTARGTAQLDGRIEAQADVVWDQERDTFEVSTDAALAGAAQLSFTLNADLGASLFGKNIWKQVWKLRHERLGIGWTGGLKYSSKNGFELNKGEFKKIDSDSEIFSPQAVGDDKFLQETILDHDKAMDEIFDEQNKDAFKDEYPEGWSEDDAIPFKWRKPEKDIYPDIVEIPAADDPKQLDRTEPPRFVYYTAGGRKRSVMIGVADWPQMHDVFEYKHEERKETEKNAFKRMFRHNFGNYLDAKGMDVEHVWDVGLRGSKFDRFDNLWPAYRLEQRLAGARHDNQIKKAKEVYGNVDGRYFQIVGVVHPAGDWP